MQRTSDKGVPGRDPAKRAGSTMERETAEGIIVTETGEGGPFNYEEDSEDAGNLFVLKVDSASGRLKSSMLPITTSGGNPISVLSSTPISNEASNSPFPVRIVTLDL